MTLLQETRLSDLATRLRTAEMARTPIAPLTEEVPGLTVDDAYRIQELNVRARLDEGERVRGRKIGLTSVAMQQQLGVTEPDFGAIFASMIVEEGDAVSSSDLIHPRAEA